MRIMHMCMPFQCVFPSPAIIISGQFNDAEEEKRSNMLLNTMLQQYIEIYNGTQCIYCIKSLMIQCCIKFVVLLRYAER